LGDMESHYRKLENLYHASACNDYFASRLRIGSDGAVVTVPVKTDFFHAGGAAHGSTYFKALDDAAYFSVNALVTDVLAESDLCDDRGRTIATGSGSFVRGRVSLTADVGYR
jgi:acyl-coenzyme A thioesterase PaaI-like protein